MAEPDKSDVCFIYIIKEQAYKLQYVCLLPEVCILPEVFTVCKLLPEDYDAPAPILDLSCFPGF